MPRLVSSAAKPALAPSAAAARGDMAIHLSVVIKPNADGWPSAHVTATAQGRDGRPASASATEAHFCLPAKAAGRAAKRAVVKLFERLS